MDKVKIVRFIKQLAVSVDEMSDAEFNAFFSDFPPKVKEQRSRNIDRKSRSGESPSDSVNEAMELITAANSREAARSYLKTLQLTRRELTALARRLQVHITKEDPIDHIGEKIIESVVGSRLNSLAIRGDFVRRDPTGS